MSERRSITSPVAERVVLTSEAQDAYFHYRRGFLTGDLQPLADYLAAGHPMDHALRKALVELIDGRAAQFAHCHETSGSQAGDGLYKLELRKKRKGAGTALSRRQTLTKQVEIASYYLQLPHGRGEATQAIWATAEHFGVERTTVLDAVKAAKERAKSS